MNLEEIYNNRQFDKKKWIIWKKDIFDVVSVIPKNEPQNRETLSRLYNECVKKIQKKTSISMIDASKLVRVFWIEESDAKKPKSLPCIIREDGFLCMYALGTPCTIEFFQRIWKRASEDFASKCTNIEPIYVGWNKSAIQFYDIDATPPGIFSKLFTSVRLKKDKELLTLIAKDLEQISKFTDVSQRILLSLAILSHGAAYRELDGHQLLIPSFIEQGKLIPYVCRQHLIAEGLKTISLIPVLKHATPIYLCQGTEFWPSQPSMLGSILANFGKHGSATEAYAHSWRRIHQHLRTLGRPLVAGHSMGGALAMQIGLYSHDLIDHVYAFNPPVPNERDSFFYNQMLDSSKKKIQVIANLDDFAFWRIGSKVIGEVTIFLGKKRWKYYSVGIWDCILIIPAFFKFIKNVHHAFPAHQCITALYDNWVSVKLTHDEINQENLERVHRFDYLHFLPKLYEPTKVFLRYARKIVKWHLEEQYLINEMEILTLHEKDLLDTRAEANQDQIEKELLLLRHQKSEIIKKLLKYKD